jgi:nucleoside-diphosphate-sugar epimerase
MKCLVTGAGGLLGFETCQILKTQGYEVWAIDNGFRSKLIPPCDHWFSQSLSDCLDQLPTDFDVIYHLAAINGTAYFYSIPHTVLTNNLDCDLLIFQWAKKCKKLIALVYASSSEVVAGSTENKIPEKADVLINNIHNPRWSYRLAKIVAENYLANSTLPWIAIRYYNVYGVHSRAGHFVADQIENQINGKFQVIGGHETRSFCYVTDAVQATINLVGLTNQQIINIGTDEETKIVDGANIISKHLGITQPSWTLIESREGSSNTRVPEIAKLKSLLPMYNPRSFDQGIQEVIKLKFQTQ